MTNVVAIHGAEPVCSEANQEVINKLKELLSRAESGEIQGLLYVGFAGNRTRFFFENRITEGIPRELLLYGTAMAFEALKRDCLKAHEDGE